MNVGFIEIQCPVCKSMNKFDTNKLPKNIKFDTICTKCGAKLYVKL